MLLNTYKKIWGEKKSSLLSEYLGNVEDNIDPMKLGRLKVRTALWDNVPTIDIPWAYPSLPYFLGNSRDAIMFSIPEVGSQVTVFYPTQDKYAPAYKGAELNEGNKCTFFDDDYQDNFGWYAKGNFLKVNKVTKETTFQHSSTTNIKIVEDGSTSLNLPNGTVVELGIDNSINIESGNGSKFLIDILGNISSINKSGDSLLLPITGDATIKSEVSLTIDTPSVNFSGNIGTVSGVSALVLAGSTVLTFTKGLLTNVSN